MICLNLMLDEITLDPGTLWMIYLKGRRMCLGMIAEDSTRNYYSKPLEVS